MVADGALKLDYASVILVDPGSWSCCLSYARSLVVHISARLWLSAHKTRSFTTFVLCKVV